MRSEEDEEERLDFYTTSHSKECTSMRKFAFVSNHLSIKLIHPERERGIYREEGGRVEEDERETERLRESVSAEQSSFTCSKRRSWLA